MDEKDKELLIKHIIENAEVIKRLGKDGWDFACSTCGGKGYEEKLSCGCTGYRMRRTCKTCSGKGMIKIMIKVGEI